MRWLQNVFTRSSPGGDVRKLDIKKPRLSADVRVLHAHYNTHREWKQDPVGYWLFRVHNGQIQAGFCKKDNIVEVMVTGTDGEAIYNTIVREGLVKSLQHAAYVGYELQKAEIALKVGVEYVQDARLKVDDNH